MSVCMCKGMQRIVLIYTKFLRRDKDGSACSKGDIAHTISNSSGSYCCCGIVTCAGCHQVGAWEGEGGVPEGWTVQELGDGQTGAVPDGWTTPFLFEASE